MPIGRQLRLLYRSNKRLISSFAFIDCDLTQAFFRTYKTRSSPLKSLKIRKMDGKTAEERYRNQSREELIARIAQLEQNNDFREASTSEKTINITSEKPGQNTVNGKQKSSRPFDINRYPCRKIALRFSYDGEQYSGLEMQTASGSKDGVAVETVESALWRALSEARIVDDSVGLQGVGWSRCGRTDRGVSAAGQVVAFWARSRKVDEWPLRQAFHRVKDETQIGQDSNGNLDNQADDGIESDEPNSVTRHSWKEKVEQKLQSFLAEEQAKRDEIDHTAADPDIDELPYVMALNRLLPKSIRVQAWSPVSPAFNARFDCQYRHYKYFFSQGAPFVHHSSTQLHGPIPPLNIDAMRLAAQRFLGEHDFRNFCRVDPSKQMDNFTRRIDGISIDPISTRWSNTTIEAERSAIEEEKTSPIDKEQMYVLNLRGTAFLYHQVRHITAILFLVGAGLEKPSIIDELLNVKSNGVFVDRIIAAEVSGLDINDGSDVAETTLPTLVTSEASGAPQNSLVQRYQEVRKKYETSNGDLLSEFDRDTINRFEALRDLYVFDRKPIYGMAMDRPLMLWECGYHAKDISWRSGTYDGALTKEAIESVSKKDVDMNGPTSLLRAQMHAIWNAQSITTEMYKHFALAFPSDANEQIQGKGFEGVGYVPANTPFKSASYPALQSETLQADHQVNGHTINPSHVKSIVPLGYGRFKASSQYVPLRNVNRQATPAEKNEYWQSTKGKRRAEKRNTLCDLSKAS